MKVLQHERERSEADGKWFKVENTGIYGFRLGTTQKTRDDNFLQMRETGGAEDVFEQMLRPGQQCP